MGTNFIDGTALHLGNKIYTGDRGELYVLPFGQMSLWGEYTSAFIFNVPFINKPNKKFMAMLLGFLDGDGYFDIGEQKQYNKKTKSLVKSTIRIRLASNIHVRDLPLLEYFQKVLGVGKISTMSAREQVRIIFSGNHPKDLMTCFDSMTTRIMPIVFFSLIGLFIIDNPDQIHLADNALLLSTINLSTCSKSFYRRFLSIASLPNVDPSISLDPYWITGFADGESSFILSMYKNNKFKTG